MDSGMNGNGNATASTSRSPSPFLDSSPERELAVLGESGSSSDSDCSVVFTAIATTPVRRKMSERLSRMDKRRSRQTLLLGAREDSSDESSESEPEGDRSTADEQGQHTLNRSLAITAS